MKAIIIIPTYNEKGNIDLLIKTLRSIFEKVPSKWEMHILFIDDSSPDGTADVIKENQKKYKNIHLLSNEEKIGLGGAYMKGMSWATENLAPDVMFEFDADLQHDPKLIPAFLVKIENGADIVIGSRYMKGGSIPKYWGIARKILSIGGNIFIRIMMLDNKIHDWTTGYRAIKPWVFLKVKDKITELKTYSFQISFLYHAKDIGAKIEEVPLNFTERRWGESKLPAIEGTIKTFWFVIKTRALDFLRSRFFKFGTVGFVGYLVNAFALEIFSKTVIVKSLALQFSFLRETMIHFITEPSAWAAALAAELSILNNFTFNNIWTFSEVKITGPIAVIRKFLQFNLASLGALIIQFVVIGLAVSFFGDTRLVRQLALVGGMPLVLSFNYVMYNLFIWRTWKFNFLKR